MTAFADCERTSPTAAFAGLVEAIGTDQFGAGLVSVLNGLCGAEHCALFRIDDDEISALSFGSLDPAHAASMVQRYVCEGIWRHDPVIGQARVELAQASTSLIRMDIESRSYAAIRARVWPRVRDRIVLCGRREDLRFGLSIVASQQFQTSAISQLTDAAGMLIASMTKHLDVMMRRPNLAAALTTVAEIEGCFSARSDLPRREQEVCARILHGLSSTGISLDLSIGEESVKTYRKRAYQRLNIGSEHELLRWYLAQWSAWHGYMYDRAQVSVH